MVRTSVFEEIIESLSDGLQQIKTATSNKTPLDSNVTEIIKELYFDIDRSYKVTLKHCHWELKTSRTKRDRYIFIGETKAKLVTFAGLHENKSRKYCTQIAQLETQINDLAVLPAVVRQEQFTSILDEVIQGYIELTKVALGKLW